MHVGDDPQLRRPATDALHQEDRPSRTDWLDDLGTKHEDLLQAGSGVLESAQGIGGEGKREVPFLERRS